MSIREAIAKKMRTAMVLGFCCWLGLGALLVSGRTEFGALHVLAFGGFAAVILYVIFLVRCPRCKAPLGQVWASQYSAFSRHRLSFCPGCGVSLDQPR